jgi:hypothetical protein
MGAGTRRIKGFFNRRSPTQAALICLIGASARIVPAYLHQNASPLSSIFIPGIYVRQQKKA